MIQIEFKLKKSNQSLIEVLSNLSGVINIRQVFSDSDNKDLLLIYIANVKDENVASLLAFASSKEDIESIDQLGSRKIIW